jgi:ADP-ribose pyrophosphatase YjhB (NUDIX family)
MPRVWRALSAKSIPFIGTFNRIRRSFGIAFMSMGRHSESIADLPSLRYNVDELLTCKSMKPSDHFRYCPQCGQSHTRAVLDNPFSCSSCGFVYYFNPSVAVAAIILNQDACALFIRRAKEPARGLLALPGGFIDFNETAEEALHREVKEEVGIELAGIEFLCSKPNLYTYNKIEYSVLDFFFVAQAKPGVEAKALDAVASVIWLNPLEVQPMELAFPSMRQALSLYQNR